LIPGFLGNTDASGRSGVVATVGGTDILSEDVRKVTSQELQRQNYPPTLAPFLMSRVLQQLVQAQEIRYEADRMGLTASDQEVRDELQHGMYRELFFPGGKWIGQQQYEQFLNNNNVSVADFEHSVRDQILQRKLFTTVTADVSVSPAEIERAYRD